MRSLWRTCSLLAGGTLVVACGDPELLTNLDTEGPPEVNMVTVSHEGAPVFVNGGPFFEAPTYCRDSGGRVNREICPEDEAGNRAVTARADVIPAGWQVRLVFSELLDPSIEELADRDGDGAVEGHIDGSQPVTLDCGGGALEYDGHYDPSGNDVSAPPGPSLVVGVTQDGGFPAATGSTCSVMVNAAVTDKDNNAVASTDVGPYEFTLANLHFVGSEPEQAVDDEGNPVEVEGVATVDETGAISSVAIAFNAPVDAASIDTADIELTLVSDGSTVAATFVAAGGTILITPTAPWLDETSYALTLKAGSTINDGTGGGVYDAPAEDFVVLFKTDVTPGAPDAAAPDAS